MIKRSPKLLANEEKATTTIQSTSYFVRFVKYMNYSSLIVFISLSIYLIMFSNRLCWLQRHCSFVTERAIPIPNQVQSPFCIAALLSEVHRTRCKIVGRLPYEGDTTLLPSHFITDQWRLFLLTHAGHHLLCSTYYTYDSNRLLMTAIAESWSQTDERTPYPPPPPQRTHHYSVPHQPHYVSFETLNIELTLRTVSGKEEGKNTETGITKGA